MLCGHTEIRMVGATFQQNIGASDKTVRRRLSDWNECELREQIFQTLLTKPRAACRVDLAEALVEYGRFLFRHGKKDLIRPVMQSVFQQS